MSFMKFLRVGVVALLLMFGLASCGSGSNNDQGTSFLALGWFINDGDDDVRPSNQVNVNLSSNSFSPGLEGDGRAVFRLIGVENRLESQFIRTTRVDCSHDVAGADPSLIIPNDSFNSSFVLGANPGTNVLSPLGDAQLESDDENVRPQVIFMIVPPVSTDIFAFLNANINLLPGLPFSMTTTCQVVGISQAGDVLVTNPASISVLFTEETSIPGGFTGTATDTSLTGSTGTVDAGFEADTGFEEEDSDGFSEEGSDEALDEDSDLTDSGL